MEVKVRNVERTDEHLTDRLNKCLLFMERGRHEQVVKPYYHGPGTTETQGLFLFQIKNQY